MSEQDPLAALAAARQKSPAMTRASGAARTAAVPQAAATLAYRGPKQTNGTAVAAFICSLLPIVIAPILGIVLGIAAKGQIRRSKGRQTGGGFATAAIVISIINIVAVAAIVIVFVAMLMIAPVAPVRIESVRHPPGELYPDVAPEGQPAKPAATPAPAPATDASPGDPPQ